MNQVCLVGRLTNDPEIRYTQGENSMAIAKYTLAVDRKRKKEGEQSADFIRCVAFGKMQNSQRNICSRVGGSALPEAFKQAVIRTRTDRQSTRQILS